MSASWTAPALTAGIAGALLLLASWERAARRRARRDPAVAGSAAGTVPIAETTQVRLVAWGFFLALLWLHARLVWPPEAAPGAPPTSPAAGWLLLAGIPAGGLLLWLGRSAGVRVDLPAPLRWPLAPFHGLAGWGIWLAGLWQARRPPTAAAREGDGPVESSPDQGVAELVSLSLEEVMIPRSQVVALEGSRRVREVLAELRARPHSLYPVHEGNVDRPLGVVHILDLAGPDAEGRALRELARPVPIFPETVKGIDLLQELAGANIPAALVVDEFGGMAGLVTVEDLMEVLIGDLEGEHELVRTRILSDGDGVWRVDGACTVEEFNRRFGPILPEGEYETVAGFFLDRAGEIPAVGDDLSLPGLRLEVLQRTERRVLWLRAEISAPAAAGRA